MGMLVAGGGQRFSDPPLTEKQRKDPGSEEDSVKLRTRGTERNKRGGRVTTGRGQLRFLEGLPFSDRLSFWDSYSLQLGPSMWMIME